MFGFGQKKREYTEQQQAFLDAMRDPANKGDEQKCKKLAGYADTVSAARIISTLRHELIEIAEEMLARNAIKAALTISKAASDGADKDDVLPPDIRERTQNAERILDRVGIVKGEKIHIDGGVSRIALIPARKKEDEE